MNAVDLAAKYEAVIGLEIHIQLATRTKIFCGCSTRYGAPANTQVCPVCLGHPGVLPVLNREAVRGAVRFGLAVGSRINSRSVFARKNYFYPDLPKGYQISQFQEPILDGGDLRFRMGDEDRSVRLTRAHLEEDAGKSIHHGDGDRGTRIDLNRAGVPLLEVVTEPDLRDPGDASACLHRLHQLVLHLGICEGNLEEGNFRCDANISVRPHGQESLEAKTEVKNLNSFRHVERALRWEFRRQALALEDGHSLEQATRLWDEGAGRTRVMRTKEDAQDYRYFPDPDLPPLVLHAELIAQERRDLPELPEAMESRLAADYGLGRAEAALLAADPGLARYYEETAGSAGDGKAAANWVLTEVLRLVKDEPGGLGGIRVEAAALGKLVRMVREDVISGKIGKSVFAVLAEEGGDPEIIVRDRGLLPMADVGELAQVVLRVVDANPGPLAEYLGGKETVAHFFVGQVMRETRGKARPDAARSAVERELETRRNRQ